ncbi:unnamed protein product [Caenorhabditis nigoni]
MCPNIRYQMTMRESGPWCLALSTGTVCMTHSEAISSSPPGVLSGLETPEEFEFVEMRANEMKKTGVWVSGVRKPECIGNSSCQGIQAFSFSDPFLSENPTGYLWNPNQPNGTSNDCLAWIMNSDGTSGIDDVSCSIDNSTCFNDYLYGVLPT